MPILLYYFNGCCKYQRLNRRGVLDKLVSVFCYLLIETHSSLRNILVACRVFRRLLSFLAFATTVLVSWTTESEQQPAFLTAAAHDFKRALECFFRFPLFRTADATHPLLKLSVVFSMIDLKWLKQIDSVLKIENVLGNFDSGLLICLNNDP